MLAFVAQNHPYGTFAHFWGILVRCFAHDAPSYSGVGASGKPGAVQTGYTLTQETTRSEKPHHFLNSDAMHHQPNHEPERVGDNVAFAALDLFCLHHSPKHHHVPLFLWAGCL
jgi:hypothetical protein